MPAQVWYPISAVFPSYTEPLHLRNQSGGLDFQQSGSAISTIDFPAASLQRLGYNRSLAQDQLVQRKFLVVFTVRRRRLVGERPVSAGATRQLELQMTAPRQDDRA